MTSPEVVEKAKTLSAKARVLGDKKGECVALTITVINAFYGSDSLQLVKAVQHLQQVSRANGSCNTTIMPTMIMFIGF